MNALSITPLSFKGHMVVTSYQNGTANYDNIQTTKRADANLRKLAFEILQDDNCYMPVVVSKEDADRFYSLLSKVTGQNFKNISNEKVLFMDGNKIVFGDRNARMLGGENISLYV